jgi:hypothetical protein
MHSLWQVPPVLNTEAKRQKVTSSDDSLLETNQGPMSQVDARRDSWEQIG